MIKKALIFDLDDTIYPVKSIADQMFAELYALIKKNVTEEVYRGASKDLLTVPFQKVAARYAFDKKLNLEGLKLSREMSYEGIIEAFGDYELTKDLQIEKFLVTTGFTKLQQSKIRQLGIEKDFKEIFIPDPDKSDLSKKDIFQQIMQKYHYEPDEILVIGDNPESEIAAAKELGMETYLYDYEGKFSPALADHYATSFINLKDILS